jgi:hypothetical protein
MCAMSVMVAAPAVGDELFTGRQQEQLPSRGVAPSPCCAAAIVPAGNFEVEANYSGDGLRGSFVHTSDLTLKYSLSDRVQLQVGTRNLFVGGSGVSPRAVDGLAPGVKLVFMDEGALAPQLAISAHGIFPTLTFADALQRTIDLAGILYASKDFGPLHFDATLNLTLADLTGVVAAQGGASLTATWNFDERWALGTGPYTSFGNVERLGVDGGWFAAVTFCPFAELALSAGAEAGFYQDKRDFSVFAGVAWVPSSNVRAPSSTSRVPHVDAQLLASR